jgi:hypothetical protein
MKTALLSLAAGGDYAGVGEHNFLPPDDACSRGGHASPGSPAHVMLTDRDAEHIPGCNMAFSNGPG